MITTNAAIALTRLLQDPSEGAKSLYSKLSEMIDEYRCLECGFDGAPEIALDESGKKILAYCPKCTNQKSDPIANKA